MWTKIMWWSHSNDIIKMVWMIAMAFIDLVFVSFWRPIQSQRITDAGITVNIWIIFIIWLNPMKLRAMQCVIVAGQWISVHYLHCRVQCSVYKMSCIWINADFSQLIATLVWFFLSCHLFKKIKQNCL